MNEKTEQPTQKKLRDARKKGQVAKSKEVVSAATLVLVFGLMMALMSIMLDELREMILKPPEVFALEFEQAANAVLDEVLRISLLILAPFIAGVALMAIVANAGQIGLLFAAESIKPKLDNLNPAKGIKKIFGKKNLVEFLKSTVKIVFLSVLLFLVIRGSLADLVKIPSCGITCVPPVLGKLLVQVIQYTIAAYVIVAAADFAFEKYQFTEEQKMTKDEVKREFKESEGDPHVKGHRKQFAQELIQSDSDDRVRKSSAVVTNPIHYAVAIDYRQGETPLPIVRAKGQNITAQRMVQVAQQAGVPVLQNVPVARGLFDGGEIDQYIPSDMIEAVAEVLRFVQELEDERR